jgi:hypothetical protein
LLVDELRQILADRPKPHDFRGVKLKVDLVNVLEDVSSTGNRTCVNRVVYCATGTEIYISPG